MLRGYVRHWLETISAEYDRVGLTDVLVPFAELVRLSRAGIANEMREEYRRRTFGE